jgi:FixJ family two-component response regulator
MVFVVDDDEAVRKGLARLLGSAGFAVETFASAAEYTTREAYGGVGCVVLDICMPGLDGMGLQSCLAEEGTDLPIIFLTGHGDIPMSVRAMKKGAFDFLTKPVDEDVLLTAIRQALLRHRADRRERLEAEALRARLKTLTPREHEVMRWVITGELNKQIAARLGIAEKTVKIHRGQVMRKLGLTTVAELVQTCQRVGIMPRSDLKT